MWPPTNVVGEHKRRANCVWVSLVILIISYSLWLIISTYEKRRNPSVSLSIKDERYAYPTITLCVISGVVGFGCDSTDFNCASTMYSVIHSPIGFKNINGDNYTSNIAIPNEAYPGECVDLDQSDMAEVEYDSGLFPPRLTFVAQWFLNSGTYGASSSQENSEGALVFFTDPEIPNPLASHNKSTFVGIIPFTRELVDDIPDSFTMTDITMELTESVHLDGSNVKSYSTGTISTKDYLMPSWDTVYDQDLAVIIMQIWQPSLSHTIRKDVDPLEWGEILGNVGGTWEMLLILWGILFIARNTGEPELKGRNFTKAAQKGVRNVVNGANAITSRVRSKRNLGNAQPSETSEVRPAWDVSRAPTSNLAVAGSRPSVEGLIRVPPRNAPSIDDTPRPAPRPY